MQGHNILKENPEHQQMEWPETQKTQAIKSTMFTWKTSFFLLNSVDLSIELNLGEIKTLEFQLRLE